MAFAVYLPVGPGEREAACACDALESVAAHSDGLAWCVLVDDAPAPRDLAAACGALRDRVTVLRNPREGGGRGWSGGLCVADLVALQFVHDHTTADFVLKLDSDSLVIAPFEHQVRDVLAGHPDAGLLGVIGDSFGENRTNQFVAFNRAWMQAALSLPDRFSALTEADLVKVPLLRDFDAAEYEDLLVARELLRRAMARGYPLGEYCQGGGYVTSRRLIDAMAAADAWRRPLLWRRLNVGEDLMMAMHCAAAGLRMYDVSQTGPRFAIQPGCIALSRQELVTAGYSLIHSIKGQMEEEVRTFFRERRLAARA
jgi:hypothetical protein